MLEIIRGNKVLLGVNVHDPDRDDNLVDNLKSVEEALFLIKLNKKDLNTGAIVNKTNDVSYGIMLDAIKYAGSPEVIPGVYVEAVSSDIAHSAFYNVQYDSINDTLTYEDGTPVAIGSGNRLKIEDSMGNYAIVWVKNDLLSGQDQTDQIEVPYTVGSLLVRLDPDDTKDLDPRTFFFGLQLKFPWDSQEIDFGTDLISIKLDTVTNN